MEFVLLGITILFIVLKYTTFISSIIFMVWVIKIVINKTKLNSNKEFFKNNIVKYEKVSNERNSKYKDINKNELLSVFNTNELDNFKDKLYKLFLDFEYAYDKADYNTMKSITTKQLFQNYYTGISLDLKYGKKRNLKDIEKVSTILYEVFSSTAKQVASMMIEISYYNYTIDKNNNVISGDKNKKSIEKFEVVFRKDYDNKEIKNCPNCGAVLNGNKCDFCNTPIESSEFKISSIKKIVYY